MTIAYSYGNFLLHDGVTYFVEGVPLDWPDLKPVMTKIARLDGMKKNGETRDQRQLSLTVSVMPPAGTRAALDAALDALDVALNQRGQTLILHGDGRYFVGDCVGSKRLINHPAYVAMQLDFVCYQPFALSPTPQNLIATSPITGSGPYLLTATVQGGGTIYALPTITITNTGAVALSGLTLTNVTQNVGITLINLTLNPGEYCTLQCDPGAVNSLGYTITKNGLVTTLYDFAGTFPTLDPIADVWTVSVAATAAPTFSAQWQWTPRYLA